MLHDNHLIEMSLRLNRSEPLFRTIREIPGTVRRPQTRDDIRLQRNTKFFRIFKDRNKWSCSTKLFCGPSKHQIVVQTFENGKELVFGCVSVFLNWGCLLYSRQIFWQFWALSCSSNPSVVLKTKTAQTICFNWLKFNFLPVRKY